MRRGRQAWSGVVLQYGDGDDARWWCNVDVVREVDGDGFVTQAKERWVERTAGAHARAREGRNGEGRNGEGRNGREPRRTRAGNGETKAASMTSLNGLRRHMETTTSAAVTPCASVSSVSVSSGGGRQSEASGRPGGGGHGCTRERWRGARRRRRRTSPTR